MFIPDNKLISGKIRISIAEILDMYNECRETIPKEAITTISLKTSGDKIKNRIPSDDESVCLSLSDHIEIPVRMSGRWSL
jgi:hypothetical protein